VYVESEDGAFLYVVGMISPMAFLLNTSCPLPCPLPLPVRMQSLANEVEERYDVSGVILGHDLVPRANTKNLEALRRRAEKVSIGQPYSCYHYPYFYW